MERIDEKECRIKQPNCICFNCEYFKTIPFCCCETGKGCSDNCKKYKHK